MTALQAAQHANETGLSVDLRRAPLAEARTLDLRAAIDWTPAEN